MSKQSIGSGLILVSFFLCVSCNSQQFATITKIANPAPIIVPIESPKIGKIVANAIEQSKITHSYDPAYVKLAYPGGDVPMTTGACTDVVIRAFRSMSQIDWLRTGVAVC